MSRLNFLSYGSPKVGIIQKKMKKTTHTTQITASWFQKIVPRIMDLSAILKQIA